MRGDCYHDLVLPLNSFITLVPPGTSCIANDKIGKVFLIRKFHYYLKKNLNNSYPSKCLGDICLTDKDEFSKYILLSTYYEAKATTTYEKSTQMETSLKTTEHFYFHFSSSKSDTVQKPTESIKTPIQVFASLIISHNSQIKESEIILSNTLRSLQH